MRSIEVEAARETIAVEAKDAGTFQPNSNERIDDPRTAVEIARAANAALRGSRAETP